MAFNLENMTVSYKSLLKLVPTQRTQLAQSGAINDLISALTPGQLVNLFPRYYRDQLPDVGQVNQYSQRLDVALSGGSKLTSSTSGGVTTYGNVPDGGNRKALTPEEKAIQEIFEKAGLNQIGSGTTSGITDNKGRVISTASTDMTPQERALLDTIAMGNATSNGNYWESPDYNTIVGKGGKFESYEDHPRIFGTAASTAAGRYQFTKTTWDDTVIRYNKQNPDNPITDFSPANQDRAALFLAENDYRRRTRRNLKEDLNSPPENFGDLIRYGLGGSGDNTTWQIFQLKKASEIQDAFESNYERNIGYVKEIEAAADQIKDFETAAAKFDPSMLSQLDQRLQNWYNTASDIQKKKFETAIEKLGTDQFNEVMKRQPVNSPTLDAVGNLSTAETRFSVLRGNIEGVDPRLINVIKSSSNDLPEGYTVKMISGQDPRTTGTVNHPNGLAMDVQIYDNQGNLVPHNRNSAGWKYYEMLYRSSHIRGKEMYPDQEFIWGGAWISKAAGRGDPMHYQIVNRDVVGSSKSSGSYSFESGLDPSHPFVAEGGQMSSDEREQYDSFIRNKIESEKISAKEQELRIKEDAAAKAQASPGTATAAAIEPNTLPAPPLPTQQPVAVEPNKLPTPPVLANGGNIEVPTGEDIVGLNTKTGEAEFFANSRENIRVEPGTLENKQQMPVVTQEDMKSLETPTQAINTRQQPVYRENLDPDLYYSTSGDHYIPPSQLRATNRAKLHGDDSTGLVNNHFA